MQGKKMKNSIEWGNLAQKGYLASGIDPGDRRGKKNAYIDLIQKLALEEVLDLKGSETVLDFGCGSGRMSYWIAPRVRKVIGLELTPEMIKLAERYRKAENVEFVVYDGIHFPLLPHPVDLVLSVGVLQTMEGEVLRRSIAHLAGYLRRGGRFYLIEQASDNPRIGRPSVETYLHSFREANLECLRHYPIRNGRGWLLYLIRYGFIPERSFLHIARREIQQCRNERKKISYYRDYLFVLVKN
jgi:SAM-dependent methyltransferase